MATLPPNDPPDRPPQQEAPARRSATDTRELLARARKRFKIMAEAEAEVRKKQLEDQQFDASDQWDPGIRDQRKADRRPCLTINRIRGGVKQITNDQRNNPPSITINPVDDDADQETAEVFQGLIRNIETQSDAPVAYETAGENAARIGLGFIRVYTEYADDQSFQQQIRIARVFNRFTVYVDPSASEWDKRDMRDAFITADLDPDAFRERYPDTRAAKAGSEEWASLGDTLSDWYPESQIRIAEYFFIEEEEQTFGLFGTQALPRELWPDDVQPVRTRVVRTRTVRWIKMTGFDLLEESTLPGSRIPIIPVIGDELLDDHGRADYRGIVRDAKDPQRIDNVMESATVEQIGLGPRAPYVMAEGQDEGYEELWKTANSRNWARLIYKPATIEGQLLPPPQRNVVEPPIQATVVAAQRAENNLRAVMGFLDVHGNEQQPQQQSGRAILARQQQAQAGNINFIDNLARAIRSLGRLLIEWIPIVYEVPQVIRILGIDDTPQKVLVHSGQPPALPPGMSVDQFLEGTGIKGIYDLSAGKYDVTVTAGPTYQSRRQESVAAMSEFVRAFPPAFPLVGDILTKAMDWPGAQQVSQRLKKMLPPQLQDQPDGGIPPQVQAQLQQLQAQNQHLMQLLQMKTAEGQLKLQQTAMQEQGDTQRAQAANQVALEKAQISANATMAVAQAKTDAENFRSYVDASEQRIATMLNLHMQRQSEISQQLHEHLQSGLDRQHERVLALLQHQHAMQQGAQAASLMPAGGTGGTGGNGGATA